MLLFWEMTCGFVDPFHSAVGAVSVGDSSLYVCGGFDGVSSLDTVEKYDPDLDRWSMQASMTKHRSAAGVVQV